MHDAATIQWKSADGWQTFDTRDLLAMSRTHAINLFSGRIPVIALEDGRYITNREDIAAKYRAKGSKCLMFTDIPASERSFNAVGFLGE